MDNLFFIILGSCILLFLCSLFSKKISYLLQFLVRGAIGVIGFSLVNAVTGSFGAFVGVNIVTIIIVGLLGIPGFISLYLFQLII